LYFKNFPKNWTEENFKPLFEKHGTVTSLKVEMEDESNNKGYGFVSFEISESGKKAIDELNNYKIDEQHTLYIGRFEKKSERSKKLKIEMSKGNTEKNLNKSNL